MQKKYALDLQVVANERLHERYILLRLTNPAAPLPLMLPGQFVQVRVDGSDRTFLRRPLSIHFVDYEKNELWLLIQMVGDGTRRLASLRKGDTLNVMLPLGRGFSMPSKPHSTTLLVGGGVGIAPLLFLGSRMKREGFEPVFLLGARTKEDLLQFPLFSSLGQVFVTTEDGSMGERGFVTQHSMLAEQRFEYIRCCGPKPMMLAVARYARENAIDCEVSLENQMACGIGACLCCVEDTQQGNLCVCKEGPVFNIDELKWQI